MHEPKAPEHVLASRAYHAGKSSHAAIRLEDPNGLNGRALKPLPGVVEHRDESGYVYIARLDNGTTKVGFSENPRKRIRGHAANGRMFGINLVSVWVSPVHANAEENEESLLGYARSVGRVGMRPEYFTEVDFDGAVAFAQQLTFQPVDVERIRREQAERYERNAPQRRLLEQVFTAHEEPAPRDLPERLADVQSQIAAFFGRRPDGTYAEAPKSSEATTHGTREQAEAAWESLSEAADANGCCLECYLRRTPIDLMEETLVNIVQLEALRLANHARSIGRHDLVTPVEETIRKALPDDDPRFDTERDPASDCWEYNPLVGYSLRTKQGDVLDIVDELPPGVKVGIPRGDDEFGSLRRLLDGA